MTITFYRDVSVTCAFVISVVYLGVFVIDIASRNTTVTVTQNIHNALFDYFLLMIDILEVNASIYLGTLTID